MPDIIKTIESWRRPERVRAFLGRLRGIGKPCVAYGSMVQAPEDGFFLFQLGRGQPQRRPLERLWFVYQGKIYGHFRISEVVRNVGQFEDLVTMYKRESLAVEWHLKPDNWVVVCAPRFEFHSGDVVFHEGFQGWRYFDFEAYRQTTDAKVHI
jgi:hypothetical protein